MKSSTQRRKQELKEDQINFDEHLLKVKKIVFKLFTYYNKKIATLPKAVFYLLSFLQFLQTLFFVVNKDLGMYTNEGPIVAIFQDTLSYLNGLNIIRSSPGLVNFLSIIIVFLFLTITLALVYYSYFKITQRNPVETTISRRNGTIEKDKSISGSKLQTLLINVCIGSLMLVNTVLAVPLFALIFPVFYCTRDTLFSYSLNQSNKCYDVSHIIALVVGLFALTMLLVIKGACIVLLYERNPLKDSIYACDNNISLLFKNGVNIIAVWYYIIDPQMAFKPLYLGGLVVVYGWYLFMFRWQQIGFYDKKYMNFILCLQILLCCFAANNLIQYFLPGGTRLGISFAEFVLASCLLSFSVMSVIEHNKKKMIEEYYCNPQATKKCQQAEQFFIELIHHLLYQPNRQKRQINTRIFLKQMDRSGSSKLSLQEPEFSRMATSLLTDKEPPNSKTQQMIVYQYLRIIIQEMISIKKCFLFEGIRCALLFEYGLKTKALWEIYRLEVEKLGWIDQFLLFEIKQRNCNLLEEDAEQQAIMAENTVNVSQGFEEVDQEKIVVYDQYVTLMSALEEAIAESIFVNKEFWSEVLEDVPDFQYIKKLTFRMQENHRQIEQNHKSIQSIFQNSIRQKFLYYSYLQILEWSRDHHQDMLEFLQENQQQNRGQGRSRKLILDKVQVDKFSIAFEQNERIIMIELDFTSQEGIVKNCNSEVFNYLGYTKNELIGRKIDKILPAVVAQKHQKFVQNFINRKESISKSSQRIVYAVTKSQYITPGFLTIKVISSEQKGIKLVSFIRPLSHQPRTFGILTAQENTMVTGVSKEIQYKIKDEQFLNDIKNESIYLQLLFPRLKIGNMRPNEYYEAEMTTFNNIEKELEEDNIVTVAIKYETKCFQEGLQLRYYYVKFVRKHGNTLGNSNGGQVFTSPALDTCNQLPLPSFNTTRLIQNFAQKRESQRKGKVEQLCRFKQNYLKKYSQTKYFMCLITFVLAISAAVVLCVFGYLVAEHFQASLVWNKLKLRRINMMSLYVSELGTRWMHMGPKTGVELQLAKQEYALRVEKFNQDFKEFRYSTQVSDVDTIFNLRLTPASRWTAQKINTFFNMQTESYQYDAVSVTTAASTSQASQIVHLIHRNAILRYTEQINRYYIEFELNYNIENDSELQNAQRSKMNYSLAIVGFLLLFSGGLWLSVHPLKEFLNKNLELVNFLACTEIYMIVGNLTEYLKIFLSSQLQSTEQLGSDNKMLLGLGSESGFNEKPLSNRQKIKRKYHLNNKNGSPVTNERHDDNDYDDENSLNVELRRNERNSGYSGNSSDLKFSSNFHSKPRDHLRGSNESLNLLLNAQQPGNNQIKPNNSANSLNKFKNYLRSSQKKQRQSEHIEESKAHLQSLANLSPIIPRSGTALAGVSKISFRGSKENIEAERKDNNSKRKISFLNDSEVLGLELTMSAFDEEDDPQKEQHSHADLLNSLKAKRFGQQQHNQLLNNDNVTGEKQEFVRASNQRSKSMKKTLVEINYPTKYQSMIMCFCLVFAFGMLRFVMYRLEWDVEESLVANQSDIRSLAKISSKLMFLRSFMGPYFFTFRDQNGTVMITKDDIMSEIYKLQGYTTEAFPKMWKNEKILKDIYRDIQLYLHLIDITEPIDFSSPTNTNFPSLQLINGIDRIEQNFLARHTQMTFIIQSMFSDCQNLQIQLKSNYVIQLISSILVFGIILFIEYYIVIWKVMSDQKATFCMVACLPLKIIVANKSIYKAIKKESSRNET